MQKSKKPDIIRDLGTHIKCKNAAKEILENIPNFLDNLNKKECCRGSRKITISRQLNYFTADPPVMLCLHRFVVIEEKDIFDSSEVPRWIYNIRSLMYPVINFCENIFL